MKGKIASLTYHELKTLTELYNTQSDILNDIGLRSAGANFASLKVKLIEFSLYDELVKKTNKVRIQNAHNIRYIQLDEKLVENSTYNNRTNLKRELINNEIFEEKCAICGMLPEWYGLKLVLILDHINGINNDNRVENLRLLCPNCNSQTDTFCGRHRKQRYYCTVCGKERKSKHSKICNKCSGISNRKVADRPNIEKLQEDINDLGYCGTGRKYGVSDNAIRKWL